MPLIDVVNLTVWYQIKPYLPPGTKLTSVRRPAQAQLDFIVSKARRLGYRFPEPATLLKTASWQPALEFMIMLFLPDISESLPAVLLPRLAANYGPGYQNPWQAGLFHTIRLIGPLPALRVHARGGIAASSSATRAFAGTLGRWFAIGDVVLNRTDYKVLHALPGSYTHQDDWLLLPNTVLNVGLVGRAFHQAGGALQAEWVEGPTPQRRPIAGFWSDRAGRA